MSRVTSLQGLYITNPTDDFKFHHGYGSVTPTTKEIRNEYARMSNHRLQTVTERVKRFIETAATSYADNDGMVEIIACSLNTQSLVAHSRDITSDSLISECDYLICSETWMDESLPPVNIEGFQCEVHNNNKRLSMADKSITVPPTKRKAGGVCIYKNIRSLTNCKVITRVDNKVRNDWGDVGDICMVSVEFKNQFKFLLGSIYIHPGVSQSSLQYFMSMMLNQYSDPIKKHIRTTCSDTETPMMLCGDFNVDVTQNKNFSEFMKREFNMNCVQNSPSTLGNTCLDLTFTRNINVSCMPFVTYFSYHRPIINKIVFDV